MCKLLSDLQIYIFGKILEIQIVFRVLLIIVKYLLFIKIVLITQDGFFPEQILHTFFEYESITVLFALFSQPICATKA